LVAQIGFIVLELVAAAIVARRGFLIAQPATPKGPACLLLTPRLLVWRAGHTR